VNSPSCIVDLPLCQALAQQVVIFHSKFNLLFENSIFVFLLMSHPLEYHPGYDGNRFLDKPCLPMKLLV